ncbi:hypothetical protein [Acinetobacter gyllenbergii]|uniref:Uncharacterized protein n=1 Tax=Acinetobacter gyllenbergii CIP 110306 = MTCC 11365 TaxID=1217657 RepID=A0A829HCK5_9GAMM|nr:hypothetical protein [Acinetobacter gyllenbergii]EPF70579.1 hypothetical protein F957_03979 [Acinetobacter gyllenbergii CIP 110306 = MTCC 11365]ESK52084.1 hypothetical protein F987_01391 [Acinetobacter gyllenbergii NIPH 230]
MKKTVLYTIITLFLLLSASLLFLCIKKTLFSFTHKNWVMLDKFEIIESEVYCSHKPFYRGINRAAYRSIKYKYTIDKKNYYINEDKIFNYYRTSFFESCENLKIKNTQLWNNHKKNGDIKVYISKENNIGEIHINENQISLKTSWLSLIVLELQGIIATISALILCTFLYLFIKKN